MVNQPEKDTQGVRRSSSKLVLPAPPDEGLYRRRASSPLPQPPLSQTTSTASGGFFSRLYQLWRKDPAYTVLSLAITLVIIASLTFVVLGAHALLGGNNGSLWSSAQTQHPAAPTVSGTVDNKPSFPTPNSNKGSSSSSQPKAGPTPNLQPTPTAPSDQGTLSVQIVSIPNVVRNNTRVLVIVQTSEPGVSVRLQVTYDAAPFFYNSNTRTTSGDGTASLTWNVRVLSAGGNGGNGVQATVIVTATDRNGQQAVSQPATVMVTG